MKYILGLFAVISLFSCRDDIVVTLSDEARKVGDEENWVIYRESTIAVDEMTDQSLMKVDSSTLIFEQMTAQLLDVKVGSTIVSGIMPNAPRGYLRKVVDIEEKNGKVILITERASWTDAFEGYNIEMTSSFENVKGKSGGVFTGFLDNLEFNLPITEYHPGGNENITIGPRINTEFAGDFVAKFVGDNDGLVTAEIGVKNFKVVSSKLEIIISGSSGQQGLVFSKDDPIWQDIRGLGSIPIGPGIAVEPVVQYGVFSTLALGATGRIGLDFSTNRFDAYARYSRTAGWDNVSTPITFSDFKPFVQIEGEARADIGILFGVGFAPYSSGLVSMGINTKLFTFASLKGEATFVPSSPATIFSLDQIAAQTSVNGCFSWGLGATPGVFVDIPLLGLFGAETTGNFEIFSLESSLIKRCLNEPCTNFAEFNFDFICDPTGPRIAISARSDVFNPDLVGYTLLDNNNDTISLTGLTILQYSTSYLIPVAGRDVSTITVVDLLDNTCRKKIIVNQIPCDFTSNATCSTVIHDDREAFADGDYCVVEINNKQWIAGNMNYAGQNDNGRCYAQSQVDCGDLGRLYTYDEAMFGGGNFNNVCPAGFRLPTLMEWSDLIDFIGGSANAYKLKSEVGWSVAPDARNNEYGFDVKPGGFFGSNNPAIQNKLGPQGIGRETYFWTSSELRSRPDDAWAIHFNSINGVKTPAVPKDWGAYCRCIEE